MYSVVLMAALTTGGDTPDFGFRCRGCRGCHSGYACAGCHGCSGWGGHGWHGHGWSYGYGCVGCYGCAGFMHAYACYGGWTCYGCAGTTTYAPAPYRPAPPRTAPAPEENGTQARVNIQVPADAKLFVDGMETKATSENRVFTTPPLERGRSYYYELRVEVVRDGRTLSETRQLVVRPGETATASFASLRSPNAETLTAQGR